MTKNLILLLILVLGFTKPGPAQEATSKLDLFKIQEGELFWQCIYSFEGNSDSLSIEIEQLIKRKVYTHHILSNDAGYDGEIQYYQIDCKKYGRNYFNTPKIYWDGNWFGKFFIEIKDNQYRVTVFGLFYERKVASSANPRHIETKRRSYDKLVIKGNDEFKRSELDNLLLLSLSLKDEFDFQNVNNLIKGDW